MFVDGLLHSPWDSIHVLSKGRASRGLLGPTSPIKFPENCRRRKGRNWNISLEESRWLSKETIFTLERRVPSRCASYVRLSQRGLGGAAVPPGVLFPVTWLTPTHPLACMCVYAHERSYCTLILLLFFKLFLLCVTRISRQLINHWIHLVPGTVADT